MSASCVASRADWVSKVEPIVKKVVLRVDGGGEPPERGVAEACRARIAFSIAIGLALVGLRPKLLPLLLLLLLLLFPASAGLVRAH
jgi:hypothetical protein